MSLCTEIKGTHTFPGDVERTFCTNRRSATLVLQMYERRGFISTWFKHFQRLGFALVDLNV